MGTLAVLAQALTLAYSAGLNIYATVAIVGFADRMGWIGPLPGALGGLSHGGIIALAGTLYLLEFAATLIPGIASAWDTVHTVIRPPAAAAIAASTAWDGSAVFVLAAALLGGGLGIATHTTKLGLRYAIDTSPEPVTNAATNTVELGLLSGLAIFVWTHPFIALSLAMVVLVAVIMLVRRIWQMLMAVFSGNWVPSRGYLQEARGTIAAPPPVIRIQDDQK